MMGSNWVELFHSKQPGNWQLKLKVIPMLCVMWKLTTHKKISKQNNIIRFVSLPTHAHKCPPSTNQQAYTFNKLNLQLKAFKFHKIIQEILFAAPLETFKHKESLFALRWITPADYDAVQISHCQGAHQMPAPSRIYPFTWLSRSNRVCRSLFWPLFRSMWRQALRTLV